MELNEKVLSQSVKNYLELFFAAIGNLEIWCDDPVGPPDLAYGEVGILCEMPLWEGKGCQDPLRLIS